MEAEQRSITITWDAPFGASDVYQVAYYIDDDSAEIYGPITTGVSEFSINGLIPFTSYTFEVYNRVGETNSNPLVVEQTTLPDGKSSSKGLCQVTNQN